MAFSLLSLTAVAIEQPPLYQALITAEQNSEQTINTKIEQEAFAALKKRLTEMKKVERLAPLDVAPFHFRAVNNEKKQEENNAGLCVSCHDNQAHSKSVKLRSFLNMHTKTIACQTCHFSNEKYPVDYQWQTTAGQLVGQIDFANKEEYLLVATYQSELIMPPKNSAFAKDLISQWQQAEKAIDKKQQALLWQSIHQPLNTLTMSNQPSIYRSSISQEQSKQQVSCTTCHQQTNPRIDLAELGADKQRQQRFEQNIIARFFKRYRKEDDKINLLELLK